MSVGERMKSRRKELKLNADYVAEKIGVSRSTIFRYEKGDIEKVPIDILEPLSKVLQTTPEYLMGWDQEVNYDLIDELVDTSKKLEPLVQEKILHTVNYQLKKQDILSTNYFVNETLSGYIVADSGKYIYDKSGETIKIPGNILPETPYDIILQIVGNSMDPLFSDGEYIFIQHTSQIQGGTLGIFFINKKKYLKKLYIDHNQKKLISLSEGQDDIIIDESDNFEVIGKVLL